MENAVVREVTADACTDLHYVDTGMFEMDEYGAVYLLDAERPALVETGTGANHERVLEAMAEIGIEPEELEVIAVTHVHLDHAGGAGVLAESCPNADVYVPSIGADHLADPSRLVEGTKRAVGDRWEYYADPVPLPKSRIVDLEDGDSIDLGDHELRAHAAPGHAPHQVVFEDPTNDAVFTGDAAGLWIPLQERIHPTSPPPNFDLEGCLDDLETIRALEPSVLLYTHFGPREVGDDLGAVLERYATVLREWVDTVESKRTRLEDDDAVIEQLVDETAVVETWGRRATREEVRMNAIGVLTYLDRE